NSTEIWQAADWREDVIDRELKLAAATGMNTVRVFVQYLVWESDPDGLLGRMNRFLEIAQSHGIRTMWVLFDDCVFGYPPKTDPYLGPQGDPKPGEYSPYWTPSPGHSRVDKQEAWPQLERYVRSLVARFREDDRVLAWDLYNEPGNSGVEARSRNLVEACFRWARLEQPAQPLTVGLWEADFEGESSRKWLELSDIITFHAYDAPGGVRNKIAFCAQQGRPVICTECVIRRNGNTYQKLLPLFAEQRVGWLSWGLVQGRTQTWLHWGSQPGSPEPEIWQHDLYRPDLTPFDADEIELIRRFRWLSFRAIVPTSLDAAPRWRYSDEMPSYGWHLREFDDSKWYDGLGAFGTAATPWIPVRTKWASQNLWLRCEFEMEGEKAANPYLRIRHDEHVEVYLNGVLAAKVPGWNTDYDWHPLSEPARRAMVSGRNVLAVHVHQTTGGQGIDVGLVDVLTGQEILPALRPNPESTIVATPGERWSGQRARAWFAANAPIKGFNYVPRTAVNTVEMWHADTFDARTIGEELQWAANHGYNAARVFLQYAAWEADEPGFLDRFEQLLALAASRGVSVMPVFFDDCCFSMKLEPWYMRQDEPVPGVINSGWVPSPGYGLVLDTSQWPRLQQYVRTIVRKYREDPRIKAWDVYNEPGPFFDATTSFALADAGLGWVRELNPAQPCTVAVWGNPHSARFAELSDVVSVHYYGEPAGLEPFLRKHADRPILCTEWLTRPGPCSFEGMLPLFARYRVGWYHWGLVAGRTQTYYSWSSQPGAPMPKVWMCDVLHPDGTPYDPREMERVRSFRFDE
ncbi:MAG: hypothetical protein FJ276_17965, partial [Planctomycetes bacterium]|nr:hypothetical protein [Planctomycetota bacterium]